VKKYHTHSAPIQQRFAWKVDSALGYALHMLSGSGRSRLYASVEQQDAVWVAPTAETDGWNPAAAKEL
jgi:hypothetical protein